MKFISEGIVGTIGKALMEVVKSLMILCDSNPRVEDIELQKELTFRIIENREKMQRSTETKALNTNGNNPLSNEAFNIPLEIPYKQACFVIKNFSYFKK